LLTDPKSPTILFEVRIDRDDEFATTVTVRPVSTYASTRGADPVPTAPHR